MAVILAGAGVGVGVLEGVAVGAEEGLQEVRRHRPEARRRSARVVMGLELLEGF